MGPLALIENDTVPEENMLLARHVGKTLDPALVQRPIVLTGWN
jgi:hypothetical protein